MSISQKYAKSIARTLTALLVLTVFQATAVVAPTAENAIAGMPNPGNGSFQTATSSESSKYVDGAYIIDAGATTGSATKQTVAQGLKPYGLIYALVKAGIPVEWIINPSKGAISQTTGNSATDFQYDCDGPSANTYLNKNYKSGAFLIRKDFALQAASIVTTWKTKGVVVDGPCTQALPNLPVYSTIQSWPRVALDAQNGAVAVAYFQNAEIPQGSLTDPLNPPAYRFVAPSALTPCDDMYVMPHADPTYATHSNLIQFVKNGGDFYASCHAVSIVENMTNGSSPNKVMNFLSTNGLVKYDSHSQGSPAYTIYDTSTSAVPALSYTGTYKSNYNGNTDETGTTLSNDYTLTALTSGDPIAQFLGVTDAAQQQGSEQIFMPNPTSRWRPTTQIVVYDQSQTNSPNVSTNGSVATNAASTALTTSVGPAASVAYGPAFGNSNYGQVMYVGGHSSNKGTVDDVATQRLFFNFLLLAATNKSATPTAADRAPTVTMANLGTTKVDRTQTINVSGSATGGSGVFKYQWTSKCYNRENNLVTGVSSGSFSDSKTASTVFTPPSAEVVANCNLTLTAIDSCGRFSFGFITVAITPTTDIRITQSLPSNSVAGTPVSDSITISNIGGQTAASVLFKTIKPSNARFVGTPVITGAPLGSSCTFATDGSSLTCDLKDVPAGTTLTVEYQLDPISAGAVTSIVQVTTLSVETDESNNNDSDISTAAGASPIAKLTLSKTPDLQYVKGGGDAAFRIQVKNESTGDFEINNITLAENFTTGGSLECSQGGNPVFVGGTQLIETLSVGSMWVADCLIKGVTGSGSNSLSVSSATYFDGSAIQNVPTPTSQVVTVTRDDSMLTFKKTLDPSTVLPGQPINYHYKVTNSGSTKTGVRFQDVLPNGLTFVSGSATVKSTRVSGGAAKTARVILQDKFYGSTVGSDTASSTYAKSSSGNTDRITISSSSYYLGFGMDSSKKLESNKTYSVKRNFSVTANDAPVSIGFDCYVSGDGTSGKPSLSVYVDGAEKRKPAPCGTSRAVIDIPAMSLTAGSHELEIRLACPSSNCDKFKVYIDDLYVIAGATSFESFNAPSVSNATGNTSKLCWSKSSSGGNQLAWGVGKKLRSTSDDCSSPLSSSDTATYRLDLDLPAALYATATLQFRYSNEAFDSSSYFKIGTDVACSSPLLNWSGGSITSHGDTSKNSKNETMTAISLTPSGPMQIFLCFKGSKIFTIDDIIVLGAPLGTATNTCIDVDPERAFDASCATGVSNAYTIATGDVFEITFQAFVPEEFPDPDAVGIVNLASLTTREDGSKKVYSVIESPFDDNPLVLTKTVDSSTVLSGERPTFTYTLHNSGAIKLVTLSITDNGCSPLTYNGGALPISINAQATLVFKCTPADDAAVLVQTETGTVSATASQDPTDATVISNVAGGGDILNFKASQTLLITVVSPGISVHSVTPTSATITSGSTVGYTYVVKNTGTIGLSKVRVNASNCPASAYFSGDANGNLVLDKTESWTFKCVTGSISADQTTESVTATGYNVFNDGAITSGATNLSVTVQTSPTLTLTKQIKDGSAGTLGATAVVGASNDMYSVITLVGTNGPISNIVISDEGCAFGATPTSGDTDSDSRLDDGETWTYECHTGEIYLTETATAVAKGEAPNTARTPIVSNPVSTFVEVQIPEMLITIEPRREYVLAGTSNTYTYTVKNIGGKNFTGFIGSDSHCATPITFGAIAMGETATATCSYAIPVDTLSEFGGVAQYAGGSYIPDTSTVLVFAVNPRFDVVKKATVYVGSSTTETRTALASSVTAQVGDRIVFTYYVSVETTTGASQIEGLNSLITSSFVDSDCGPSGLQRSTENNGGDLDGNGYMDPLETWVFTCVARASLTSGGGSLRAGGTPKLAKISNGGLIAQPKSASIKTTRTLSGFANATSSLNSPVTFTVFSSLDSPDAVDPLLSLTASSSVTISVEGVSVTAPPSGGSSSVSSTPVITFNPNSSGLFPTTQTGNGQLNLNPNPYQLNGFNFKGWSTTLNGVVKYLDKDSITLTGDITLFAVWEEIPKVITPTPVTPSAPVKVSFKSNCAPFATEYQSNAGKVKLNSNTFTCAGYAFAGWSSSPTGDVEYLDQAIYNFATPATLFAIWNKSGVATSISKGEYRFEVFFDMNSILITTVEKKNITNEVAIIKKKAGPNAVLKVVVEGWVQPNPKPGNIKYLSQGRAKNVAAMMKKLGLKATYKELYKGLGVDNMPKARHASVIVTWTANK